VPTGIFNAPITINGTAGEHTNLSAVLAEHASMIAREVCKCSRSNTSKKRL
jgi:hypothetical protein